jgi:hypothetical protein
MTNVTISGNRVSSLCGGFYNLRGGAVLTNVLVEKNYGGTGGGVTHFTDGSNVRAVLVITNGIIRGNKATSIGGGICNYYTFGGNVVDNTINRLALTNVLIAENEAPNGGGIYNNNPVTVTASGKGINILMNNVTIANNRACTGAGGGIHILAESSGNTNKITVSANNSIIWGNAAPSNTATNNIYNPTTGRLTLSYSLAQNGTYANGGSNKTAGSFTDAYGPFAGNSNYAVGSGAGTGTLINGGGNSLYPLTADVLLGGNSSAGALAGTGDRDTVFRQLITTHVITPGYLTQSAAQDVTAAIGDRYHTTTVGAAGDINTVTVTDTPPAAAVNYRFRGVIDVGAYERQE